MSNLNNLFKSGSEQALFHEADAQLTAEERKQLHTFYRGCHTTTNTAKGATGAAIAVWMAYASRKLQQRRIKVKLMYPMLAGVGVALVIFQVLTPSIYESQKLRLITNASPGVTRAVETLEPVNKNGSNAYQIAKYFSS